MSIAYSWKYIYFFFGPLTDAALKSRMFSFIYEKHFQRFLQVYYFLNYTLSKVSPKYMPFFLFGLILDKHVSAGAHTHPPTKIKKGNHGMKDQAEGNQKHNFTILFAGFKWILLPCFLLVCHLCFLNASAERLDMACVSRDEPRHRRWHLF